MTIPLHRVCLALFLLVATTSTTAAAPEPKPPKALTVDPAPAPVPALKYRLLPATTELNPGDAAPIYLRLHCFEDEAYQRFWRQIVEKYAAWKDLPLDQFPMAEAGDFVDRWSVQLRQLEFGTRRQTCDWNYTLLEQRLDRINVILPDAQVMREWCRLLAIKARVEIAEKKHDDAIRTLETGIAFGRHVAEGPFFVNSLIGIAIVETMLGEVDELIAQPGAPNLYWTLTALPRPLIDQRRQLDNERTLCENLIPELTEALSDEPRSDAEWTLLLERMHRGIVKWSRYYAEAPGFKNAELQAMSKWDLQRLKAEVNPKAMDYLVSTKRLQRPRMMPGISADKVAALYLAARHQELWDDLFKASYLPVREALPQLAAPEKRLQAAKDGPLGPFVALVPAVGSAMKAQLRVDRHVAALRVIEAIRLHAEAHDGKLPEALDRITVVPVPDDPATGEPFVYRVEDGAAILQGLQADLPYPSPSYRITIRHGG